MDGWVDGCIYTVEQHALGHQLITHGFRHARVREHADLGGDHRPVLLGTGGLELRPQKRAHVRNAIRHRSAPATENREE